MQNEKKYVKSEICFRDEEGRIVGWDVGTEPDSELAKTYKRSTAAWNPEIGITE